MLTFQNIFQNLFYNHKEKKKKYLNPKFTLNICSLTIYRCMKKVE